MVICMASSSYILEQSYESSETSDYYEDYRELPTMSSCESDTITSYTASYNLYNHNHMHMYITLLCMYLMLICIKHNFMHIVSNI